MTELISMNQARELMGLRPIGRPCELMPLPRKRARWRSLLSKLLRP